MRPSRCAVLAALALCACTAHSSLPPRPLPSEPSVEVQAIPTPLVATRPAETRAGSFVYAGGIELTTRSTSRLHGLSDLKVWDDDSLLAVSDDGDVLEAHVVHDARGRLVGLRDATLTPLLGQDGRPLAEQGKAEADAEGIAEFPNGGRIVSFERRHRILDYSPWGRAQPSAAPDTAFPDNAGMEALAQNPGAGGDAYIVGAEESGQTWHCDRLRCVAGPAVSMPKGFGLVALDTLPGDGRVYLLRAFSVLEGVRVILRIVDAQGAVVDELKLAPPLTVDNYEGVASVIRPNGSIRFYLLSDDNFSKLQRTLLVAFDWQPTKGREP